MGLVLGLTTETQRHKEVSENQSSLCLCVSVVEPNKRDFVVRPENRSGRSGSVTGAGLGRELSRASSLSRGARPNGSRSGSGQGLGQGTGGSQ